ncbi:hypothetical protein BBJ28_00006681 [Nothophytophthora sp. Chile5]|nr:hypothetical protein BBJ28_00006681 [Nothophytophthora sp. Chile5]
MAGGDESADELSVATLVLGADAPEAVDEQLNAVRKSVIAGDATQYLAALKQASSETAKSSPLVYLMEWFHTWQQEYEAFVHVLGMEEESGAGDHGDAAALEKDLADMETEAGVLMQGFGTLAMALLEQQGVESPDSVVDRHGWTLLMQAANSGLPEMTDALVACKADVNYGGTAKDSTNPLYLAIESEHTAVAMLLLKNGAIASATKIVKTHKPSLGADSSAEAADEDDVEEEEEDCALFQACRFGHLSVIKEMLALGVDVNFAVPSTGDRALHVAVMFEMQNVVELLVASDAIELNATNASGQTCLFGCSSVELVKLLVTKGVDPKVQDVDSETALTMAHALGDDEVAQFLETLVP